MSARCFLAQHTGGMVLHFSPSVGASSSTSLAAQTQEKDEDDEVDDTSEDWSVDQLSVTYYVVV